jgi:protoporphyrinogen/coproporphyrinogen III oxidase
VGEIVLRRLGSEVTTMLAGPLIGGIHAGSVDALSAAAVFPALLEADRSPGSLMRALRASLPGPAAGPNEAPIFLAPRGGMGRLVESLTGALAGRGVDLRRETPVLALVRQGDRWTIRTAGSELGVDGVVVAMPGPGAADLLEGLGPSLGSSLRSISYSSVALLTFRIERGAVGRALDGSGFLVPRGRDGKAEPLLTACTWLSAKWPELGPDELARDADVLLRVSVGRAGDRRHEDLDDDELVRRCLAELDPMMGGLGAPTDSLVTSWPLAFPQYAVGHLDLVRKIEADAAALPALALAGAAFHGVGIPACIGSGRRAAQSVLGALAPKPAASQTGKLVTGNP